MADTLNYQVAASSDDAQEDSSTNMTLTGASIRVDNGWYGGFRFDNIAVAQADTIIVARFTATLDPTYDDMSFTLQCEDIDDSPTFTTTSGDISNRTLTTASVTVVRTAQGTGPHVFDITDVIQEVIDRGSWASGNALSVILSGGAGANERFYSYDNASDYALLEIIINSAAAGGLLTHPGMSGGMRG